MTITTEASKRLMMESENAGDFLMIRPDTGRVISTTRMADEKYLAVKVCHGVYMTGDEFKGWQARDKTKRKKAKSR